MHIPNDYNQELIINKFIILFGDGRCRRRRRPESTFAINRRFKQFDRTGIKCRGFIAGL